MTAAWSIDFMRAVPSTSGQALAMPCKLKVLRVAIMSSLDIVTFLAQTVIAVDISLGWLGQNKTRSRKRLHG